MKPVSIDDLPALNHKRIRSIDVDALSANEDPEHAPRILVLYGSLRQRSFSRLCSEEATRLLQLFGAEVRTFNPKDLPLPDSVSEDHPKVKELRELATWSEGMVWVSPERHGAMTGIMKSQIDWIPLSQGSLLW